MTTTRPGLDLIRTAAGNLACGLGSIRERLIAAVSELTMLRIEHAALDPDMRLKFEGIMRVATTKDAIADEGLIAATINQMTDDEAVALARLIVELHVTSLH